MHIARDPALDPNTPLDPRTSVSPVMAALVRIRARQCLHHAACAIRGVSEVRSMHRLIDEIRRAEHYLGVAEGQVLVLYDTPIPAWPYLRACKSMRAILNRAVTDAFWFPRPGD